MSNRWFEAFRRDPQDAVSALFTGRAGVGSNMRLDVPDLLYQWFPPNLTEERTRLDDALLSWLRDMQRDRAELVLRIGFAVYGKRVGDALIALQLLDLPQAKSTIRADMDAWLSWLSPLRLAPERDPALECYRLLTRDQPPAGHVAMWLRLAMDRRPEYLTVALAGLQLLPNGGDARKNQALMLQALLRHAITIHHDANGARKFFNRHLAALRGLFPRTPQHWNRVLEDVLDGFPDQLQTQVAKDLTHDLREKLSANLHKSSSRPSRGRAPARRAPARDEEWRALETDILDRAQSSDTLACRLFEILERNHDHASATGDSYFFVRTLSNLGSKLLVCHLHHPLGPDNMARFGTMIERALVWEPANPYCWTLWAKWFQAQGQKEAQEAILREMLRMFPSDAAARVELARLLIARGEEWWDEAEHHLRRTIDQDTENAHAHLVMARLQALRGQYGDAEATLAGFVDRNPNNRHALGMLNKLQAGTALFDDSSNDSAQGEVGGEDSSTAPTSALQEVLRRGRLTGEFSRARITGRSTAVQTSLITQESQKGDALAGFYSQWLKLHDTPECPPHAWAWNACQHWQKSATADVWRELAIRFPEAVAETDFLRALAWPDTSSGTGWQNRYCSGDGAAPRAVDALMHERRQLLVLVSPDYRKRDELACEVMACVAADAPKFTTAVA